MKITSSLPLGASYFRHWHIDDTEVGIAVAKAVFTLAADGSLSTVRPPPDLVLEDSFAGDPAHSPLVAEQDIAPGKPGSDLTVSAVAHAPDGRAADWPVSVTIPEKLHYGFHVRGPCYWSRGMTGWSCSRPEPVAQVPLTYALAYGGPAQGDPEAKQPEVHLFNPAGLGFATDDSLKGKATFPAAQIGDLGDFMATTPQTEWSVHGLGPIAKSWQPRLSHAGTFDSRWEQTRHPRMPDDYDLRFWNVAPTPLQISPYLDGDETVQLAGMTPGGDTRQITLPGVRLKLAASGPEVSKTHTMKLDTVHIDIADPDPAQHRLTCLWRCIVTGPDRFTDGHLQSERIA